MRRTLSLRPSSSSSSSSSSTAARRATTWSSMIRQIWQGDDHINPKKLLERQYLYRSLLALRLRELMLANNNDNNNNNTNNNNASSSSSFEDLYETATADLDERQLERLPNVDLRNMVQELVRPQVRSIFHSIRAVDDQMGIRYDDNDIDDEDGSIVLSRQRNDDDEIYSFYRDLLLQEYDSVQRQMSGTKNPHRRYFFDTKSLALETILQFHGWQQGHINSIPLLDTNHNSSTRSINVIDPFGMDLTKHASSSIALIRHHQTVNLCRAILLRRRLGYSVLSLRSSIAGRGLFLDGCADLPGTVLAFFPGDVWPKEHLLTSAPDVMDHFANDDDSHISLRFDDYVVDARLSPVTVLSRPGSCNPYALAHMANHATNAPMINCQSTMLDFVAVDEGGNDTIRYIPNAYARPPTWQSRFFFGFGRDVLMHGLSLLSLRRTVSNQELLYDYRLQSDEPPDWYQPIPDDTLPQVVFFREDWQRP